MLNTEEQFSAVSHSVTAKRGAKTAVVLAAMQAVFNILSCWMQMTKVRNQSLCGRPFSRELAVARRDRSPVFRLWQPVVDLQHTQGMIHIHTRQWINCQLSSDD